MNKKIVCLFYVLIFLISCSDEKISESDITSVAGKINAGEMRNALTEQEIKVLFRMRNPDNRVSIEEAMKLTNEAIAIEILNGESTIKSSSNKRINSISALVSNKKSADLKSDKYINMKIPDTLAYILNFNDSLGYAIISADTRINEPILALTRKGSLAHSTDNPGIAVFLEMLENYMLNSIVEAEQQKDSLLAGIRTKLGNDFGAKANTITISYDTLTNIGPLVPVAWGQEKPFSDALGGQCSNTDNGKYLAGCVAVATAQIMSYWEHPTSLPGSILGYSWTRLNRYKHKNDFNINYTDSQSEKTEKILATIMVKDLFQRIGTSVNMNYGCNVSLAYTNDAIVFLRQNGFITGSMIDYDYGLVIRSMKDMRPLIVNGCAKLTGCHAWVLDGYLNYKMTMTINNTPNVFTFFLINNNWGWDGLDNGWFSINIFNPAKRVGDPFSADTTYDFKYNTKISFINLYR